jgi:hypothetical protein
MTAPIEQHCNMLLIEGWSQGFNKVAFTRMLQQEFDLSLAAAKGMTDQILEGKPLAFNVAETDIERISSLAQSLGAIVRRDSSVSVIAEDSCQ